MRIAVTGATGFIGGRIARSLARAGHEVLSYGRRDAASLPGYVAWNITRGPIADPGVDAVVHCAAFVGDWGSADRYRDANIVGAANVLDSFRSARRFVHMSSSSVYSDDVEKTALREDASIGRCRHSAYGRTKAEAECRVLGQRPDAVVLRPHVVYGPGDTTLLPQLLSARRGGYLPIPGNGRNHISVTHVDNLVDATERAIVSDARGAFNVSDAEPAMVDELLRTVLARSGATGDIAYVPRSLAWGIATALETVWPKGNAPRGPLLTRWVVQQLADDHTLDITRSRELLGYSPRWTFRDGPLFD